MKRYSGLHDKLCTIENIEVADDNARKNKNKKYGINKHDKNRQYENEDLVDKLFNLKCKFYYRYADDIVILSDNKDFLHKVLIYIKLYVHTIGLKVKDNYQIYPVNSRGINFVGYVFYHTHTLIRKSIKYKIIRLVNSYLNREIDKKEFKVRMCAYYGWLKHSDAKNLLYKIQSLTGVRYSNWNGKRTNIAKYYGKYVRIIQVINYAKYFRINFIRNGKAYYADSRDKTLFYSIHRLNHFPINFKITKYDWRIYAKNRKEKVKPQI